jgi:hypothetical protein
MFKDWGVGCSSLVELGALSIQVQDDLPTQRKVRSMERLSRELVSVTQLEHDKNSENGTICDVNN